MNHNFIQDILDINPLIIKLNYNLKNMNTMKLESICKYFILPKNFIELKKVMKVVKKYNIKYFIIGNGSNLILTKKPKECIIKLDFISKYDCILMGNNLLSNVAYSLMKKGYGGLEYVSTIPASIGGAIIMNAGCYNHHLSDIIEYVYYLDEDLNFKVLAREDCDFSYRNSYFKNKDMIILGCKIKLIKKDKNEIHRIMKECLEKRKQTQPIEYPNSGSIFKNPKEQKAYKLIQDIGLQGYKINGAMISNKHCNFIINYDKATSSDVLQIINLVKKRVKFKYNIELEEEIIIFD